MSSERVGDEVDVEVPEVELHHHQQPPSNHLSTPQIKLDLLQHSREDVGIIAPPNPPDRGYGWFVVLGSFVCNFLVDGCCFSYGVMQPHVGSSFYDASPSQLSMPGSLLTGTYLLMGPISSALANLFGCRIVTMVGGLLSCLAFFGASYMKNVGGFIGLFGFLGGIGFGLIYLPAVVTVGFWFEKRRAFATGIAVCGSGIGTAVFAPLTEHLMNTYSWRGALMIIAGLIFNCAVAASFFMPIERYYEILTIKERRRRQKHGNLPPSIIMKKVQEHKERERTVSQGSLNGWIITKHNDLMPMPPDFDDKPVLSTDAINRIAENVLRRKMNNPRKLTSRHSFIMNEQLKASIPQLIKDYAQSQNSLAQLPSNNLLSGGAGDSAASPNQSNFNSQYSLHGGGAIPDSELIDDDVREAISAKVLKEMCRPINRKDVFFSGSLYHLPQYTQSRASGMGTRDYYKSVTSLPAEQQAGNSASPLKSAMKQMLDVSILLSPTFVLLLISSLLTMLGFLQFYQFIKMYAIGRGVNDNMATWLVSAIGFTNTIGRIVSGWASDRPWANSLWINNLALMGAGAATFSIPFCSTYVPMLISACIYGLFISAFVSLRTILVVELMGLDRLTNAFGILLLFQGFGMIAGSPLASLLDQYSSAANYSVSFYASGTLLFVSGVLCIPLRRLSKWEKSRWSLDKPGTPGVGNSYTFVSQSEDRNPIVDNNGTVLNEAVAATAAASPVRVNGEPATYPAPQNPSPSSSADEQLESRI